MEKRLIIADDHELVRDALASHARATEEFEVVDSVPDAQAAVNACRLKEPDILLLDIEMPGRDALSAIPDVKSVSPGTLVVILSAYCRDSFIELALRNGADGYLVKQDSPSEIFDLLCEATPGAPVYSKDVLARLQPRTVDSRVQDRRTTRVTNLTPREIEVLRYIGQGLNNRRMAEEMCISCRTVERHVSRLMDALNIRERASLMNLAHDQGLVE
jgi:DNA-binding NarL/FixJ family response regulator